MTKFFLHPLIYTFFVVTQCRCQGKKTAYNTKSIELNNIAVQFMGAQKFDSALLYLVKAIEIEQQAVCCQLGTQQEKFLNSAGGSKLSTLAVIR